MRVEGVTRRDASDRRHAAARPQRRRGHAAGRGAEAQREGARRARDAGRSRPQRRRPRLRVRIGARAAVHGARALLARDAPDVDRRRASSPTIAIGSTRWCRAFRPAPCRARRRCARWRSSASSSRRGAASTPARSATSTSPATSISASRSARVIMSSGKAYVQAGAGIVIDSNPAAEYEETRDKARALLRALELAQAGLYDHSIHYIHSITSTMIMVLVIDNYDSFTYNLVQYLGELGAEVHGRAQRRGDARRDRARWRRRRSSSRRARAGPRTPGMTMDVIRAASGQTTPILGVCLGHQAIGAVFGGAVVRAPRADARQDVDDRARRPRRVHRHRRAVRRRRAITRWSSPTTGLPAELEVTARTRGGRHRSWACGTGRWPVHGVQFHPESILTGEGRRILRNFLEGRLTDVSPRCIEKLTRHEDLTTRRGGRGDGRGHGGPRHAGADRRRCSIGLAMKGERPAEIVGLARTMRAHAVQLSTPLRRRVRHLRHRRRSVGHVQHLVVRRAGRRRVRRAGREARQPIGVEPVRQRRRVRGARRQHRRAAGGRRALPRARRASAFFFAPTFHPSMRHAGADAPRARACGRRSTCSGR